MTRRARRALVVGLALVSLSWVSAGSASIADETALAERFAPVIRLVEQAEECGYGEPYRPIDIDAIFGEQTVSLRGPWNQTDLVDISPVAKDLGLYEYHLDFPGEALDAGCDLLESFVKPRPARRGQPSSAGRTPLRGGPRPTPRKAYSHSMVAGGLPLMS